jgi:hypothetical protein
VVRKYYIRPLICVCHDVHRVAATTAEPERQRYEAMSNRRPPVLRTISHLLEDLLAFVRLGLMSQKQLAAWRRAMGLRR